MSMLPHHKALSFLLGTPDHFDRRPSVLFAEERCLFLRRLSERLLRCRETKAYPDCVSFAFWCRRGNIEQLMSSYKDDLLRLGRGVAFHIAPSNVPMVSLFSWAFSFLAGNANIVRLPAKNFPQVSLVLNHMSDLFREEGFSALASANVFVRYGHEDAVTSALSAISDVRLIWGGDETMRKIRTHPLPPRAVDLAFADRWSFCILNAKAFSYLEKDKLTRLAHNFFNDTYLIDQNACSSPRMVVWLGSKAEVESARELFWGAVSEEVNCHYTLQSVSAVDKYVHSCLDAIELAGVVGHLKKYGNELYILPLNKLPEGLRSRWGTCGYFYEYAADTLDEIALVVDSKCQTLTYYGLEKEKLASFVRRNHLIGIDRIVPVGAALDISPFWDGHDLLRELSRLCNVR